MMQIDIFDQEHNAILGAPAYDEFAARLRAYNCRRCELADSRSHIVVDRGNPSASILVISERPGENEDATGKAFVGRAGELLDKILESIGLDSNRDALIRNYDWYLANVDKLGGQSGVSHRVPWAQGALRIAKMFF